MLDVQAARLQLRLTTQSVAGRFAELITLAAQQNGAELLGRFDVEDIAAEALLFQTGYLTIKQVEQPVLGYWLYTLGYPNHEVEISLNKSLLPSYGISVTDAERNRIGVLRALMQNDISVLATHFTALFAAIPHDWYRNNPIARYEGYYASVFYSHLAAIGLDLHVEDASNAGQVDLALRFKDHVYLFEFKVVEQLPDGSAITQLKQKGYADKYRTGNHVIHLIGVEFSRAKRQIVAFDVEQA